MAVQGDTCLFCTLQTSSLNSCYVWIKRTGSGSLAAPTRSVTLNCIPCQLQTRRAAEEVTGLTPLPPPLPPHPSFLICSLLPVFFPPPSTPSPLATHRPPSSLPPMGHSISMPPTPRITVKEKTEWCTEDTSRSDGGTFFEYSNKTQGLSCQITLTPSVKIPATSLRERRSRCPGFAFLFWTELSRFAREGHWRRRRWKEWALRGFGSPLCHGASSRSCKLWQTFFFFNAANERRVLPSAIHVHLLRLVSYFVWDRWNADVLASTWMLLHWIQHIFTWMHTEIVL